MFTGIIQSIGTVVSADKNRLAVRAKLGVKKGDSVAVEGVCLTVTSLSGPAAKRAVSFDVSEETLRKTTLGELRAGRKVNLETAARVGDPLGGHIVQGHVEGTGTIVSKSVQGASATYEFTLPLRLAKYLVPKGSVAVDGVSLTVVNIHESSFTVAVIPFTESHTTLGLKKPGDSVNLETDILAKYVENLMRRSDNEPSEGLFVKREVPWDQFMREEGYK